ncbi:MAG: hypothetical protein CMJ23_06325 [Phycisphaerae bacterium]|nr:hypothetical protein [Phycisphaerae bacterium]
MPGANREAATRDFWRGPWQVGEPRASLGRTNRAERGRPVLYWSIPVAEVDLPSRGSLRHRCRWITPRADKDDAVPEAEKQSNPGNIGSHASPETGAEGGRPVKLHRRDVLGSTLRALALGGVASVGLIGCATTTRRAGRLPDPDLPAVGTGGGRTSLAFEPKTKAASGTTGTIARVRWAGGTPNVRGMNAQASLKYITIHHDGLPKPLVSAGFGPSKARLELIRTVHVRDRRWADIGYHYAIDRNGRIWDCRPLRYEGAHVKSHNPGNIGILVLGNFDLEKPTSLQLRSLCTHVNALCLSHGIKKTKAAVRTHREWASASTACPGRYLQPKFSSLRARGFRV